MTEVCEQPKLIVTIVERGKGQHLIELYRQHHVYFHVETLGKGTAKTDILEYLGIGESDKDVIFSLAAKSLIPEIWQALHTDHIFKKPGNGIAFTIPLASISGKATLDYVLGKIGKENYHEEG